MNSIHPQFFVINLVTKSGGEGAGIRPKGKGGLALLRPLSQLQNHRELMVLAVGKRIDALALLLQLCEQHVADIAAADLAHLVAR